MRFHPLIADADQALALQPVVGHPGLRAQRTGQTPVALRAHTRPDRGTLRRSQGQQMVDAVTHPAPLFPVAHADASPQPVVQLGNRPVVVRDAEVAHPTTDIFGERLEPVVHGHVPTPTGELAQPVTEVLVGALRPAELEQQLLRHTISSAGGKILKVSMN